LTKRYLDHNVQFELTDQERWKYIELNDVFVNLDEGRELEAVILFMMVLRIFNYFQCAPTFKFMLNVLSKSFSNMMNTSIILFMSIFAFALLAHIFVGQESAEFIDFFFVIIQILKYLMGFLVTKYIKPDFEDINNYFYIAFLIMIKIILFTFLFVIVKQAYEKAKQELEEFIVLPHVKLMKGTLISFIKFWDLIRDFNRVRKVFKDVDAEHFVKIGIDDPNILLNYQKITFEKRMIFLIHEEK